MGGTPSWSRTRTPLSEQEQKQPIMSWPQARSHLPVTPGKVELGWGKGWGKEFLRSYFISHCLLLILLVIN